MLDPLPICTQRSDGLCQVSTRLAGLPVVAARDACQACCHQQAPQTVNPVTCSKAAQSLHLAGLPVPPDLLAGCRLPDQGMGSQLALLIEATRGWLRRVHLDGIIPTHNQCGCDTLRVNLNAKSPQECWKQRREIVGNLRQRWSKHWPPARYLPAIRLLITAYLWLAIKRQENH